jgi:hypothetical protein
MGADWLKFRVPPDADLQEVRRTAQFVSEFYPHGNWIGDPPADYDDVTCCGWKDPDLQQRWQDAYDRLWSVLEFPGSRDESWYDQVGLTDPPGMNIRVAFSGEEPVAPALEEIDRCRVYVISDNAVFPIEWRDEAYRIILPDELPGEYTRWCEYIGQVGAGDWEQYLHELYLFERLQDPHQLQELEGLEWAAAESLSLPNAWCRKERLFPVRDEVLASDIVERLQAMLARFPQPEFDQGRRNQRVLPEQLELESEYHQLRAEGTELIRNWNRCVPQKWKRQYPERVDYESFAGNASCVWLDAFFEWCESLIEEQYGLFLWA